MLIIYIRYAQARLLFVKNINLKKNYKNNWIICRQIKFNELIDYFYIRIKLFIISDKKIDYKFFYHHNISWIGYRNF